MCTRPRWPLSITDIHSYFGGLQKQMARGSKTITSQKIITVLTEILTRFGNPKVLISDNGPQLISEEFETFLKANGIQHSRVSPYFPKAKGQVKRFHRYLEYSIRAVAIDGFAWTEVLPDILQAYTCRDQDDTCKTDAE